MTCGELEMYIALLKVSAKAAEIRATHQAAHDAYWEPRMASIWLAGALLEDNARMGQLMIVRANDKEEAQQLIGNDPYVVNGAFEPFTVSSFRASVLEGKTP